MTKTCVCSCFQAKRSTTLQLREKKYTLPTASRSSTTSMYRQPNASTYPSDNRRSSQSQSQAPLFFSQNNRNKDTANLRTRGNMDNYRQQATTVKSPETRWRKLLKNIICFPLMLLSGYIILGIIFGVAVYTLGL
ncbi:hypothetical protein QBC32DRAFT_103534 [Pseudoneurospora amorphoporcata]|uniref:Uncharacterized protein n=1 Tax=Pseudoneurospora amorphoporcata TaxID=241081 RepID=A0AAN6NXU2_9PEZI|nr:hypothetical protein QBC32DRAFT_103534 [Pseudoneurospora amorphoporcata]